MEAKINLAKILKDKPKGIILYSPIFGECRLITIYEHTSKGDVDHIGVKVNYTEVNFDETGKFTSYGLNPHDDGEILLFPSKKMRDWRKFSWKKGDVLVGVGQRIIFEKFIDENYTKFQGKYSLSIYEDRTLVTDRSCYTSYFSKINDSGNVEDYFKDLEEKLGAKFNRETLEIEKFKPKKKPVFELGGLYVFNEEDEDGELTIIGKLIGKNEIEDTLTFGNQYEIGNEKFVADQAFDLRISIHEELREATEGEAITFQEAYTIWEKSKKQPAFKPFDKVLCRDNIGKEWHIDLFESVLTDNSEYNYKCMVNVWKICIPYEGNEHLLGTTKDVEG